MKKNLLQIGQLLQQNESCVVNQGLMHGNTGLCIFFYHLARSTNNSEYKQIADDLVNKIFDNLDAQTPTSFENGLSGIGWGIEYLVQNGFAEGDTDEILEDIDNKVFKALNEDQTSFELTDGLTGYLFYLISRLKKPMCPNSMAQRINRELLILTIDKLDELVILQFPSLVKELYFNLFWEFPVMLFGLHEALKLNVYNEKITHMINQWVPCFEAYIPALHINRLYWATVLALINGDISNERLEKQIQILLFATNFEALKTEVDFHNSGVRSGWTGVIWLLQKASQIIPAINPCHSLISLTNQEIITKAKCPIENMPANDFRINPKLLGLSEGLAGIGLMELLYPEIPDLNEISQK